MEDEIKLFAEFEDALDEYGRACADCATCSEWGTGNASAEKQKAITYKGVTDIVEKMLENKKAQ